MNTATATTYMVPSAASTFDPNQSKYKCCCNSIHVKTGAFAIGVSEGIMTFLGLIIGNYGYLNSGSLYNVTSIIIPIVVITMMIYGIRKESAGFIVPHLIFQGFAIGILAVMSLILVVAFVGSIGAVPSDHHDYHPDINSNSSYSVTYFDSGTSGNGNFAVIMLTIFVIFCFLMLALEIWWFVVVLNCFRFLRDKARHQSYLPCAQQPNQILYSAVPGSAQGQPGPVPYPQQPSAPPPEPFYPPYGGVPPVHPYGRGFAQQMSEPPPPYQPPPSYEKGSFS